MPHTKCNCTTLAWRNHASNSYQAGLEDLTPIYTSRRTTVFHICNRHDTASWSGHGYGHAKTIDLINIEQFLESPLSTVQKQTQQWCIRSGLWIETNGKFWDFTLELLCRFHTGRNTGCTVIFQQDWPLVEKKTELYILSHAVWSLFMTRLQVQVTLTLSNPQVSNVWWGFTLFSCIREECNAAETASSCSTRTKSYASWVYAL